MSLTPSDHAQNSPRYKPSRLMAFLRKTGRFKVIFQCLFLLFTGFLFIILASWRSKTFDEFPLETPNVSVQLVRQSQSQNVPETSGENRNSLPWPRSKRIYTGGKYSNFPGYKIVHIDLKGAPPKVSYLKELFYMIRVLGGSGVILEYEDMFPFTSLDVAAKNAYSKEDIQDILKSAEDNDLMVIPLVQTFGHMEFILKLEKYKHLREVAKYPQAICPSRNKSVELIHLMIDDVMALHSGTKYLHIGCDEVFQLGSCSKCVNRIHDLKWTPHELFLDHVTSVARYVKSKYPGVTVLVWDDEFRKLTTTDLLKSGIGSLVEPVVWKYTPDLIQDLPESLWQKYASVFSAVWVASAFKGARSSNTFTMYIDYYYENHKSWVQLTSQFSQIILFRGIIMTGWQRYDHFAVLCELLPVGLPSLAVNLYYLTRVSKAPPLHKLFNEVQKVFQCAVNPVTQKRSFSTKCHFPGVEIYETIEKLPKIIFDIQKVQDESTYKGWLNLFNIDYGFSNPIYVEDASNRIVQIYYDITSLEEKLFQVMGEVYDNYTITEWIYTYVKPFKEQVKTALKGREKILRRDTWPKRPFNSLEL